jgi:hypothetical protein
MKSLSGHLKMRALLPGVVFLLILSSCMKDTINMDRISNSVDWPVSYGMPVAYGGFSLGDIVSAVDNQGLVKTDASGLLYLLYRDTVLSQTAENLLTIPDQSYQQSFSSSNSDFPPVPGLLDSLVISRDTSFVFAFNKSDVGIDSIFFKSGDLTVNTVNNLALNYKGTITFPTFLKNGVPLKVPFNNAGSVSIAGYKLLFESGGTNKIAVHYDLVIYNNKTSILSGQTLTTTFNLSSAGFSSIFGYLGQINNLLNLVDQRIVIDFFSSSNNYNVKINNPSVNLYIQNSFGVPVQVQLSNTRTYSEKTLSYFPVNVNPSTLDIKYPTISQVGKTIFDTINLVSNISDAIQTSPHYFYYSETAVTNPLGKTASPNFFMDNSKISAEMELKLPFDLQAGNIETSDTIQFDIGKAVSDFSILKKLAIYNTFTNSIPFDLKLQIFLTDSNKVAIDSLYQIAEQPIIKSGIYNSATQKYESSSPHTLSVIFDEARAKKLENVKFAILKVSMSTPGTTYVKFFSDYRLNCAFQVQAELGVTSLNQL